MSGDLAFQWATFDELTASDLYSVLALRQAVFCVEQHCPFQDADGLDYDAHHLMLWGQDEQGKRILLGYARVLKPGVKYQQLAIGRLVTRLSVRGKGYGRMLLTQSIEYSRKHYAQEDIRICAQQRLAFFYNEFGFEVETPPFMEDGIPHVEMQISV